MDLTEPKSGEANIYSLRIVKAMAYRRSLNNTVNTIRIGWRRGPDRCYRKAAKVYRLEVRLEIEL